MGECLPLMLSCMLLIFEAWYQTFKNCNSGISLMLTFILALISGYSTNYVEPALSTFLKPRLDSVSFDAGDYKTMTFILLLFLVAVFGFLANETVPAFLIILGGGLGLFGSPGVRALKIFLDQRDKYGDE